MYGAEINRNRSKLLEKRHTLKIQKLLGENKKK